MCVNVCEGTSDNAGLGCQAFIEYLRLLQGVHWGRDEVRQRPEQGCVQVV